MMASVLTTHKLYADIITYIPPSQPPLHQHHYIVFIIIIVTTIHLQRDRRVWTKKVKYDVRKNFADSRIRVKGRFVKKEDEENMMRDLLDI